MKIIKKLFLLASALFLTDEVKAQDSIDCFLAVDFSYTQDEDNIYLINISTEEPIDAIYGWSVDGLTSDLENPIFPKVDFEASETVCLTIYDATFECFGEYCGLIVFEIVEDTLSGIDSTGCLLTAIFNYSLVDEVLYLENTSIGAPFGAIYNWSVDGLFSDEENPIFPAVDFEEYEEICLFIYDSTDFCTDSYCIWLSFEGDSASVVTSPIFVGVQPLEKVTMEMFPNPAKDVLTIKVSNSNSTKQVNVYSAYGELVRVEQIARENSQIILDLTDLTNGIYIVTIIDEENPDLIIREKLIKN